ncbi:polyprotein [Striga asiatica]|uniref:Polyprotein n=1 Tax=Striga asiatica TaxID=4170 RepID=A0A5A7QI46_STRAF|nr:polyprotein [Striga asiatica]
MEASSSGVFLGAVGVASRAAAIGIYVAAWGDSSRAATTSTGQHSSNGRPVCSHCGKSGHVVANCFDIIGYLDWYSPSNSGCGGREWAGPGRRGGGGRGRGGTTHVNAAATSLAPDFGFGSQLSEFGRDAITGLSNEQ